MSLTKPMRILAAAATAACAALLLGPLPAGAVAVGDTVTGVLRIAGKDVPLPSGRHVVVEVGLVEITQPALGMKVNPGEYGPVRRVLLAQEPQNGQINGVVEVIANTLPHPDGWGIATDCMRSDIYATLTRYKSGWDVSCLWIKPVAVDETVQEDAMTRKRMAKAAAAGALIPTFWIEAGFRVANRQDLIEVKYRFSPTVGDKVASEADADLWAPAGIASQGERLERVKAVAEWASIIYPSVENGLRTPLDAAQVFPAPFAAPGSLAALPTDRQKRLSQLTALHAAGGIGAAEFARQKSIIEAEAEPVLEGAWTNATIAGWKAFTYRVVVTTINAGIDYIYIGQPFAAGVLVVLQVVVNTTKFFFHEVMFQELFGASPLHRETPRVMDFVIPVAVEKP